jgi:hypothetical protein
VHLETRVALLLFADHKHLHFAELMQTVQTTRLLACCTSLTAKTVAKRNHFYRKVLHEPKPSPTSSVRRSNWPWGKPTQQQREKFTTVNRTASESTVFM